MKNSSARVAAFMIMLMIGLTMACRTSESPEKQVDDAATAASLKAKLASDLGIATITNVSINVTNGVVTLSGQVKSADQKRRAEQIARGMEKVVKVNNVLQVAP